MHTCLGDVPIEVPLAYPVGHKVAGRAYWSTAGLPSGALENPRLTCACQLLRRGSRVVVAAYGETAEAEGEVCTSRQTGMDTKSLMSTRTQTLMGDKLSQRACLPVCLSDHKSEF